MNTLTDLEKIIRDLKIQLHNTTDDKVKRDVYNAIVLLQRANTQEKLMIKKSEKKLVKEQKERDDVMKAALKELEKKRHKIK